MKISHLLYVGIASLALHLQNNQNANGSKPTAKPIRDELVQDLSAGEVPNAKALLKLHPDLLESRDSNANTVLMEETWHDAPISALRLLLKSGANINATNKNGETAIFLATSLDTLKLLLARGADPNVRDLGGLNVVEYQTHHYMTGSPPFYQRTYSFMKLMLNAGFAPNGQGPSGRTVLFDLASYPDVVKLLLSHGADPNLGDNYEETPAMELSGLDRPQSRLASARLLLKYGADPYRKDKWGKNAIDHAKENGDQQLAVLLSEAPQRSK